jgi:hypothetical protein
MANQMIALQARNPQLPDPARTTSQMANMMNMASQQRAAQLQGERIRQEMEYARAGENRAAETQRLNVRKEDQAFRVAGMTELRNRGVGVLKSGSEEAYQLWLKQADAIDPDSAAVIRQISPTLGDGKALQFAITKADEFIANNTSKRRTEIIYDKNGFPIEVQTGGDTPFEATPIIVTNVRDVNQPPRATPTTPTTPTPQAAPAPASVGEYGEAKFVNPESIPLTPFQQEHIREMQSGLGMSQPASFTRGAEQMTPQMAQQIVDTAVKTGMMAQADFDQLMAMAPEQNKQPFMDMIRANNITLQPDGMGQRPQSQFADLRGPAPQSQTAGLRGAPPMEQTLAQYRVGDPIQGKNPSVGAYPGSAQVPLSRVAGEAEARRETPAQIKVRKAAELQAAEDFEEANKATRLAREREKVFEGERAKKDAAFLDTYNDAVTKGRTTLNVIDQMIGDAQLEKGRIVVPKGGRRPHPGFEGVVGMGVPGVRFIPGTQAASFDALFRQAEGGAFLQAYESLRGTGQITEIEGTKATSALTRMERSQSEVEFVKAAREFADVIRGAVARADKRYTALTGEAPAAAPARRKTPTKGSDGWGKAKVVGN